MSERRLQIQRQSTGLSVGQLSLTELHQELLRRVEKLQEDRQELVGRIAAIDLELSALPGVQPGSTIGAAPTPGSEGGTRQSRAAETRRANPRPLREVLMTVLDDGTLTTREAADAVLATGYQTSSRNFPNTVYVVLHKEENFTRTDQGKWMVQTSEPAAE